MGLRRGRLCSSFELRFSLGEHASRGVRQRFPRGGRGARGRGPLCTPRAFRYLSWAARCRASAEGGRPLRPSFARSALRAALALGVPISAAYGALSSCCWCTTVCCSFAYGVIRRVLGFGSEAFVRGRE